MASFDAYGAAPHLEASTYHQSGQQQQQRQQSSSFGTENGLDQTESLMAHFLHDSSLSGYTTQPSSIPPASSSGAAQPERSRPTTATDPVASSQQQTRLLPGGHQEKSNSNAVFGADLSTSPTTQQTSSPGPMDDSSQSDDPSSRLSNKPPGSWRPGAPDGQTSSSSFKAKEQPPGLDRGGAADGSLDDKEESAADKRLASRFVYKLYRMVSDPESQHLICFSPPGTSVIVTNFDDFAKEVLPKHFKHSNFSSFIRQLNMYGFYKVNKTSRGQKQVVDTQVWEFSHPKFLRGRPELLEEIKRKALDTDHGRSEARDMQLNVSLGQYQLRQHMEEMQWRLDSTMEQNLQLRDFSLSLRQALGSVLEYIRVTNGGRMPFDVRLPILDVPPTPMVHSPYEAQEMWGTLPTSSPAPFSGPSASPGSQQRQPSIFVTEPHHGSVPSARTDGQAQRSPMSPQDGYPPGPFSMSSLQQTSPLASRRPSASTPASMLNSPSSQSQAQMRQQFQLSTDLIYSPSFDGQFTGPGGVASSSGLDRGIATLPRRMMSDGLAIEGLDGVAPGLNREAALHLHGGPAAYPPAFHAVGQQQQHLLHQPGGLFAAAMSTPLPPSPAVSSYGATAPGSAASTDAGYGFPSSGSPGMMMGSSGMSNVSGALPAGLDLDGMDDESYHFTPSRRSHSSTRRYLQDTDAQAAMADLSMSSDSLRPNHKAMRTPMRRTASNSATQAAQANNESSLASAAKRKSPH